MAGAPVNLLTLLAPGIAFDHALGSAVTQGRSLDSCLISDYDGADGILFHPVPSDDAVGILDFCRAPSLITVTDSLWALGWSWFGITPGLYDTSEIHSVPFVQRGLTNSQMAAGIWLGERLEDYVTGPATVTLALDPAMGVKWSGPVFKAPGPPCEPDASRFNLICSITPNLGVAPASIPDSWPIGWQTGSPNEARIGLYTYIDASTASPAAADVMVKITVTGSTYVVVPDSVRIARLNNTADATADAPTVIIGENDQQSGTVTITRRRGRDPRQHRLAQRPRCLLRVARVVHAGPVARRDRGRPQAPQPVRPDRGGRRGGARNGCEGPDRPVVRPERPGQLELRCLDHLVQEHRSLHPRDPRF